MVEMKNEEDAYKVIKYLQGSRIYEKVIELTFSHQEVSTYIFYYKFELNLFYVLK